AIASALGARTRQLASFVWSEAIFVVIGGVVLGALAGWGLSFVIVKVLTGVFDPPPEHLAVPWNYLLVLMGVTALAVSLAGWSLTVATPHPAPEHIRDL